MNVELLVVPSCPNEALARAVIHEAAAMAGLSTVPVTVTTIDSEDEARRRGFVGSPTFLLDGVDPFAVPGAPIGLSCRLYPTARGPAGVPDVWRLRDALGAVK